MNVTCAEKCFEQSVDMKSVIEVNLLFITGNTIVAIMLKRSMNCVADMSTKVSVLTS